jgi:flagellar protein FlaF
MNVITMSQGGYALPQTPVRNLRRIEYDLLARTTKRLATGWVDRKVSFVGLVEALNDNLRLWATFAADVAEAENGLPAPLRAQLFYLYQFTDKHTDAVLAGRASAEVLIDINTSVMRGLRGTGGAA